MDLTIPSPLPFPIVIADDGSYPLEANTYLVERSCGACAISNDSEAAAHTIAYAIDQPADVDVSELIKTGSGSLPGRGFSDTPIFPP
jgi:hypothetical protein